ncbi:unnamed protein product [Protopolystoma xenopodis]|uniref:Uncharacterized protein n=1 Tax=Protopolystoma xenopodis TaxID=117903 RepID=A0A3S5BR40_9PLAT|nr:unnamed protein product [Protopolystoma xenopodis]
MRPSSDDARDITNECSVRLRQQRWRVARGFHQSERIPYNAEQPTSSDEFDPRISSSCIFIRKGILFKVLLLKKLFDLVFTTWSYW